MKGHFDSDINGLHYRSIHSPYGRHLRSGALLPSIGVQSVRCPGCSALLEPGFLTEPECPFCRMKWGRQRTKSDMLVEAINAQNNGGWSKERHDILVDGAAKPGQSTTMDIKTHKRAEVGDRARAITEWQLIREKEVAAQQEIIQHLRSMNAPLAALRW